ncbi:MAG TPA: thermonuclease family protein, partial [Acidimicrobiales bacterium]
MLAAIALLGGCGSARAPATQTDGDGSGGGASAVGTVVHVVDGDTVDVAFGGDRERVRLLGIDTPETVKPNTPVQCWGPEASARTK